MHSARSIVPAQKRQQSVKPMDDDIEFNDTRNSSFSKKLPVDILTPDEVAYVIGQLSTTSFTGIRNRALLIFLYRSGLRISEALALTPAELNHQRRAIRVLHGKGDKASTRFWHPSADDSLCRWMDRRSELQLRRGPLFCTVYGTAVLDVYVRNLTRRLGREAGVEKRVHPHAFRHTYAFELDQAGVPLREISKLLGHTSIQSTDRYLAHISNRMAGEALANADLSPLPE